MFDQILLKNTSFSGRYLSFKLDNERIFNYTVNDAGAVLFSSVILEPFCCTGWSTSGALARINGEAATVMAQNNPAAVLHIVKAEGSKLSVHLTPGSGPTAGKCNESSNIKVSGALEAIVLIGAAGSEVNGSRVSVEVGSMSCEVLACIPRFSEHELSLEKATEPQTSGVPGFEALFIIAALCAAVILAVSKRW